MQIVDYLNHYDYYFNNDFQLTYINNSNIPINAVCQCGKFIDEKLKPLGAVKMQTKTTSFNADAFNLCFVLP